MRERRQFGFAVADFQGMQFLPADMVMELKGGRQMVYVAAAAGYVRDHPVERMMRDAKITQVYEGTNQSSAW